MGAKKADEEAKREKYFAQNPVSEEQKKDTAEFSRVAIETIDFMDAKSENKSESVEMASDMATGLMAEVGFIGSATAIFMDNMKKRKAIEDADRTLYHYIDNLNIKYENNYTNAKAPQISLEQKEAIIKDLRRNRLVHSHPTYGVRIKRPPLGINVLLDEVNYKKLKPETKNYFSNLITDDVLKNAKKTKGFGNKLLLIPALVALGIGAVGQVAGTILQVRASKIARFQARQELKDTKNFVEYTDEQKAQAQQIAGQIEVPKEKKSGSIRDIISLMKDYDKYQKNSKMMDNVHLYDIQEQNPQKAYERQKVLNKAITHINNTAEEYSENMETAAGVVLGSAVLDGAAFGKISEFIVKTFSKKEGKKVAEEVIKQEIPEVIGKTKPSLFKNIGKAIWQMAKLKPGIFGGVVGLLIATPLATKLQKNASRAGRYKAKRELEENPNSFVHVDDQKLSTINAKGNVKKSGFLDVIKSVPESIKLMRDYGKYKKKILPKRKAMQEALKQTNISQEQMANAEALKVRLYKSFDVIDDNSQNYSEKMEAATEITKSTMSTLMGFGAMLPAILLIKKPEKLLKPASDILATIFEKSSKFTAKYTKNIGDHAINKLTKKVSRNYDYKQLKPFEKEIDEVLKAKDEVFETKLDALHNKMKNTFDKYDAQNYIEMIRKYQNQGNSFAEFSKIIPDIKLGDFAKGLEQVNDPAMLKNALNMIADQAGSTHIDFNKMSDKDILKAKDNLVKIIRKIPQEELSASLQKYSQFVADNPTKNMIMKEYGINLSQKELFLTKDIAPIAYTVGAAYFGGLLGITYSVDSFMSAKTKEAGRLGTMKASEELNRENDQFIKQNQAQNQK